MNAWTVTNESPILNDWEIANERPLSSKIMPIPTVSNDWAVEKEVPISKDWEVEEEAPLREKGPGFLGTLPRPDGYISTELSIGVNFDGKETEIPSLVPTLDQSEIDHMLSGKKPTDAIVKKAVDHARKRIAEGKSPFAQGGGKEKPIMGAGGGFEKEGLIERGIKYTGRQLEGAAETALSTASGMFLYLPAKAYGLMALPWGREAANMAEESIANLGYKPYTKEGQEAGELLAKGFEKYLRPASMAEEETSKYSPRAGYLVGLGAELAIFAATGGLAKGLKAKLSQAKVKPAQLKKQMEKAQELKEPWQVVEEKPAIKEPMPPVKEETISSVAIKVGDKIYEGTSHPSIINEFDLDAKKIKENQIGFITSEGRYVERPEASRIAKIPKTQFDITAEELKLEPKPTPSPAKEPVVEPRVAEKVTGVKEKQPWEMGREELRQKFEDETIPELKRKGMYDTDSFTEYHERQVQEALSEGKPVPPEVLADYPGLKTSTTKEPTGKKSWQMSFDEFLENHPIGRRPDMAEINKKALHEMRVKRAISEGKITSHPDYPELGKAKPIGKPVAKEELVKTEGKLVKPTLLTDKEILARRRFKVKAVRDHFNLTDTELKSISRKDIRLMTNWEFKQFIDNVRVKADEISEVRQARNEVIQVKMDKQLKKEDYARKFYELPPVNKMNKKQLNEYTEILERFETGDEFWTPKRIKSLENTKWAGAKTIREVKEKAAKETGKPVAELETIKVKEFDRFRYDTAFARQNPMYEFMVDQTNLATIKNTALYFEARKPLFDLGKKALQSRRRGPIRRLIPQQPNIMKYIEAGTAKEKIKIAERLTKEEFALAEYIDSFYRKAYEHLIANEDLQSSRFADSKYVFHAKRPLSEMVLDIKDVGLKNTIKELLRRWKLDEAAFKIVDSKTGEVLSMKKFFRQTLYRTGELTPSKNIIKSTDIYMQQFFRKMALDEVVPTIETLVMAIRPKGKTKTGLLLDDSLMTLTKQWLNNKKGRNINIGIQQGGRIDAAVRFVNQLVTLRYIALNIPLEIASIVGETVVKVPLMGSRKLTLANTRKASKQGREILKEYKSFTGEGPIEKIRQPARNIGENINMVLYGLFKWMRKNTMQDLILGNMTKAEFKAGKISSEKLAEIKKIAGRWIDIEGTEGILGSTSVGKSFTKFKGWAIPVANTTIIDATSLLRTITRIGDKNKRLNKMQAQELYRLAEVGALVSLVYSLVDTERDKTTFTGKLKYYALRELTTISQALSVRTMLTLGVVAAYLEKFSKNLQLLVTLEKYKTKGRKGLKGVEGLKRQFTPAGVSQFKNITKSGKLVRRGGSR